MDETTLRILDALAREIGRPLSIMELTRKIANLYGRAYYPNIYQKLQTLSSEGVITLEKVGKASIAHLNFKSHTLIDLLAEMELRKKQSFLHNQTELQMLFLEIDTYFIQLGAECVCAINPEKNIKLNRIELLILLHDSKEDKQYHDRVDATSKLIQTIQRLHTIRIDHLALNRDEFVDLLTSEDRNPLKEMLSDKIAILHPQSFWMEIRALFEKGHQIRVEEEKTNPAEMAEQDLTYNLTRLGYKEFGLQAERGKRICIEYIITSIMLKKDERRIQAIPIILAKNRPNYNLLTFLAQKYGQSDRLLGLLKALNKITPKKEVGEAIRGLEAMNAKEIKANVTNIKGKMRLYHAIE